MNNRFIILMVVVGFSSLQASQTSNLTKAILAAEKLAAECRNRSGSIESLNAELACNSLATSPRNRKESAFASIKDGSMVDAGEIAANLFKGGKMSEGELILAVRAAQLSPVPGAASSFANAYDYSARMASPRYQQFKAALRDYDYTIEQREEVQCMLEAYLKGEKLTVIRLTPWPK